jgi:succinate-semialdehyde dehydrogenase/glutarate-semialdehyde dehydrogenase
MEYRLESVNPATGIKLGEAPICSIDDVRKSVAAAREAQAAWGQLSIRQRITALRRFQRVLLQERDTLVQLIVSEQGKDQVIAYGEVFSVLNLLRYYFRVAPKVLRPRRAFPLLGILRVNRIVFRPYGVVGIISPWNYPVSLSLEPAVTALLAGNGVVIKPSEHTPLTGLRLGALFQQAQLPENLVQVVTGPGETGAALIASGIDKLVFVGSVATGRKVAALAGQHLVPVTLELGGKDAAIVLADADVDRTAEGIAWAANLNAGQTCLAIERVYVVDEIAEPFIQSLCEVVKGLTVGLGADPDTDIPPITTEAQLGVIQWHIEDAKMKGARVLCGGGPTQRGGRFFEPTVVVDVNEDMLLMQEETFGPVIAVQRVRDVEEAVRLTNSSGYGLTASVWTQDKVLGRRVAARIEAGDVAVNDHGISAGHPEIPWGGLKESGYGKTRGREGLLEMVTLQHLSWPRVQMRREVVWFPNSAKKLAQVKRGLLLLHGNWRERGAAVVGRSDTEE